MASAIEIQAMVRNMDESMRRYKRMKGPNPELWKKKVIEENAKLWDEYPTIFKMHIEGKLDDTFFYMLQLKRKIEKKEITEDQASIDVGKKLFGRYVEPVVKNLPGPPTLSYEEYYKQYSGSSESATG